VGRGCLERVNVRWQIQRLPGHLVVCIHAEPSERKATARRLVERLGVPLADARLLLALGDGRSNQEIAGSYGIRVSALKSRVFRLYARLGVRRRSEVIALIGQLELSELRSSRQGAEADSTAPRRAAWLD
jgi:DNA-binding CsgD family transcriptional regulator